VVRSVTVRERRDRALGRLTCFGNATSGAKGPRAKKLRPARQGAAHQRERVDGRRPTSEQRERIGTPGIAVDEAPFAGRDQREREQR